MLAALCADAFDEALEDLTRLVGRRARDRNHGRPCSDAAAARRREAARPIALGLSGLTDWAVATRANEARALAASVGARVPAPPARPRARSPHALVPAPNGTPRATKPSTSPSSAVRTPRLKRHGRRHAAISLFTRDAEIDLRLGAFRPSPPPTCSRRTTARRRAACVLRWPAPSPVRAAMSRTPNAACSVAAPWRARPEPFGATRTGLHRPRARSRRGRPGAHRPLSAVFARRCWTPASSAMFWACRSRTAPTCRRGWASTRPPSRRPAQLPSPSRPCRAGPPRPTACATYCPAIPPTSRPTCAARSSRSATRPTSRRT